LAFSASDRNRPNFCKFAKKPGEIWSLLVENRNCRINHVQDLPNCRINHVWDFLDFFDYTHAMSTHVWKQLSRAAAAIGIVTGCGNAGKGPAPTSTASTTTVATASTTSLLFPTITAQTLANRSVVFPAETAGKVGLFFVAFEQEAQQQINSWVEPLLSQYLTSDQVIYYEIPMISGAFGMVSSFIDGGMRRGVPKDLHDRTATYYGPRQAFFDALAITDTSKPYLFVVDQQGRIVFRTAGWYNGIDAKAATDAIATTLAAGAVAK
jgi:hypothetical protein